MKKLTKLAAILISSLTLFLPSAPIMAAGQDVSQLLGATVTLQDTFANTSYTGVLFQIGPAAFVVTPGFNFEIAAFFGPPLGGGMGQTGVNLSDPVFGAPYDAWNVVRNSNQGSLGGVILTIDLSTSTVASQFTGAYQELSVIPLTGPSIAYLNNNQAVQMTWGSGVTAMESFFQFDTVAAAVPEPSTYLVLGSFLALSCVLAKRRKANC